MNKGLIGSIIFLVVTLTLILSFVPFVSHERPLTYEVSDVEYECLSISGRPAGHYVIGESGDYWRGDIGYIPAARYVTISMMVKNTDNVAGKFFIQLNSDDGILCSESIYLNPNETREFYYHENTFADFTSYDIIPDKSTIHLSLNEILFDKTNDFPESDHYNAPNATYKP